MVLSACRPRRLLKPPRLGGAVDRALWGIISSRGSGVPSKRLRWQILIIEGDHRPISSSGSGTKTRQRYAAPVFSTIVLRGSGGFDGRRQTSFSLPQRASGGSAGVRSGSHGAISCRQKSGPVRRWTSLVLAGFPALTKGVLSVSTLNMSILPIGAAFRGSHCAVNKMAP